MENLLTDEIKKQLSEIFEQMKGNVTLAIFTKDEPCPTCAETIAFIKELSSTSKKIKYKLYNIKLDEKKAKEYDVTRTPTIVVLDNDEAYRGVKFVGIPAGYEINSLISALIQVSGNLIELPEEFVERIKKIDKPTNIKVFITLGCPHCPGAVETGHRLALENPNIVAEMIEAQTFGELSAKFNVSSVPKVVINDKVEFLGSQPLEVFLDNIEKAHL